LSQNQLITSRAKSHVARVEEAMVISARGVISDEEFRMLVHLHGGRVERYSWGRQASFPSYWQRQEYTQAFLSLVHARMPPESLLSPTTEGPR
jgi:hypothetical protein